MKSIGLVVEGDGDVKAAPVFVRRIATELLGVEMPRVELPMRLPKTKLLRAGEIERAIELLAKRIDRTGGILVLVDADMDDPVLLADQIRGRARSARPDLRIEVAVAHHEFEAWLIAGFDSLPAEFASGAPLPDLAQCESKRDAKGWLETLMGRKYSETVDQALLSRRVNLTAVLSRSPSFRRLVNAVESLLQPSA